MSNVKCEDFVSTPVIRESCRNYSPDTFAKLIEDVLSRLPGDVADRIFSCLEKRVLYDIVESAKIGDYVLVSTCRYTYAVKKQVSLDVIKAAASKLTANELVTLLLLTELASLVREKHVFVVDKETGHVYMCRYDEYLNVVDCVELRDNYRFIATSRKAVLLQITRYDRCREVEVSATEYSVVKMLDCGKYVVYMCDVKSSALEYRESEPDVNKIRELLERGEDVIRPVRVYYRYLELVHGEWREKTSYVEIPRLVV